MSTFIEKDAIEYTVYNIPQSSGQDEGHTDDISGLEAFFPTRRSSDLLFL